MAALQLARRRVDALALARQSRIRPRSTTCTGTKITVAQTDGSQVSTTSSTGIARRPDTRLARSAVAMRVMSPAITVKMMIAGRVSPGSSPLNQVTGYPFGGLTGGASAASGEQPQA